MVGAWETINVSMVDRKGAAPAPRRRADSTRSASCQPGVLLHRLWEDSRQRRSICRLSMTSALSLSWESWSPGELGPLAVVAEDSAAGDTQTEGRPPAHSSVLKFSETAAAATGAAPASRDLLAAAAALHDPKTPVSQGARTGWPGANLEKRVAGCGAPVVGAMPPDSAGGVDALDDALADALRARRGGAGAEELRPRDVSRVCSANASS